MNQESPEVAQEGVNASSLHCTRKKRKIIALLFLYAAFLGVFSTLSSNEVDRSLEFFLGLPSLILAIWWCFVDARERDHRIGRLMKLCLVLLFVVAFPIYLLQTRGIRGLLTIGMSLLLAVALFLCAAAAAIATESLRQVTGHRENRSNLEGGDGRTWSDD